MEALPKLPMLIFDLKMSAADVEFDHAFKKVSKAFGVAGSLIIDFSLYNYTIKKILNHSTNKSEI